MWPYTCLFNISGVCEATNSPCVDGADCIEMAPPGDFNLISRGEAMEMAALVRGETVEGELAVAVPSDAC